MSPRRTVLLSAFATLAATGAASAGGPRMQLGAVEPQAARGTQAAAAAELGLATGAGVGDMVRVTVVWTKSITTPRATTVAGLQAAVDAAQASHDAIYLDAYPSGSSQTPLTDAEQERFAGWLAAIALKVPGLRHVIVGNEPNLNRFWLPQFGPAGEDVAAASYESTLARAYDALKQAVPGIDVLGGALAHAGVDKPHTGRDTHSPTAFIRDMGAAYRASGRSEPIMDAFAFHPYMLDSNQPPTLQHPNSTTITIADYDKLVSLLGEAFDGTAQRGSTLPIVYDEFGVQSVVPPAKQELYSGKEAATVHPVDEATQAQFYAQALALAYCQPTVRGVMIFPLVDEGQLAGWQSGLYYADGTPKTSLRAVRAAANRVRRNAIASCPGLHVTPRPHVAFFPAGQLQPGSLFSVALTCDVDCTYYLRLEKLPRHSTTRAVSGRATGGVPRRISLGRLRLAPGRYRFTLSTSAMLNRGGAANRVSLSFTLAR